MTTVCFDRTFLLMMLLVVSGLAIYNHYLQQKQLDELKDNKNPETCAPCAPCPIVKSDEPKQQNINVKIKQVDVPVVSDPVTEYDYRTLADPLSEPRRRPPRYIMDNIVTSPHFNVPTRGYPDTYSKQGYLLDETLQNSDSIKILNLFGRQKYPGSNNYDYYVIANMGGNEMKLPLEKQKRELYGGEMVTVPVINKEYKVVIDNQMDLSYNPFL
jgi:hypothetical protein